MRKKIWQVLQRSAHSCCFFCLLRSVIGSVLAVTVQSARRQARRCSRVCSSQPGRSTRPAWGWYVPYILYLHTDCVDPSHGFGSCGSSKDHRKWISFFVFFLKTHPQCEKKKTHCAVSSIKNRLWMQKSHTCALCWPVVLLHVLLWTTYAVASGVAPTQADMMTPRPLFSLPFNLESLLNCSFPFSAQHCRILLFIYFCSPRCCACARTHPVLLRLRLPAFLFLLSHTPGLGLWPWRAICHAETHTCIMQTKAPQTQTTHIADKHCQGAFCPVQTLAFRLRLYLRRCLN